MGDYEGWRLYDHGLRAPAIGAQKWQRALVKPFTNIEIPIWRGESLIGKNILLLEEQAVGDTMMFLTLIPNLIDRASTVGVYLSKRLEPIYRNTFSHYIQGGKLLVFTKKDLVAGKLMPDFFDYQSALGSICQYVGTTFRDYLKPLQLIASKSLSAQLRSKYHSESTTSSDPLSLLA